MVAESGVLDPFHLPLEGSRLIEASAGTGKTYTLSLLYLRCVVERGLSVDRILVVTFTKAATEELRARIRGRLVEGARWLETGRGSDQALERLIAQGGDAETALGRLRDALLRLDEAAIYTIHGFCAQILKDLAFESGALFDTELQGDESELRRGVVEDFWRCRFYDAPPVVAAWARARWGTPDGLLQALGPLLLRPDVRLVPAVSAGAVAQRLARLEGAFGTAARLWRDHGPVVAELLRVHPHLSRAEQTYRADVLEAALGSLEAWLGAGPSATLPRELQRFTAEAVAAGTKKKGEPPGHPFFDAFSDLAGAVAELDLALEAQVLEAAHGFLAEHMARLKAREGVFSYDDLLARLAGALEGDGGEALAGRIRQRFPVAMVDEFQDTDPLQYAIFRRIHGGAEGVGLFYIGDPKQAIYGFRGADVFTYMAARRATAPAQRSTLDTNWRSAARLVRAVNHVFERAASPFIYDDDIPFQGVKAGGRADGEPLLLEGAPLVPLQFRLARRNADNVNKRGGALHGDWVDGAIPAATAVEVARLLNHGAAGRLRLGERAVAAGDVAVLVRNHRDAHAVQQALATLGVGGVVMSRESVFASAEAWELARLLEAVARPGEARRLRAALALDILGGSGARLAALGAAEAGLDPVLVAFREAHRRWLERGFMVMFMELLEAQAVPRRLLAREGGERSLTNLLQLGELLQQASLEHHTMESLLRWFAARREEPDAAAEDQQLRLESDENLVQIVTIHRSKGLEYPVVLLPYMWRAMPVKARPPVPFHDGATQYFDLGSDELEAHHALAEQERLAEDLRLLYVALTRARHLCIPFWGYFHGAPASAMAHLLHGPGAMAGMTDEAILAGLVDLAAGAPECIAVADLDTGPGAALPIHRATVTSPARAFTGTIDRRWRIHSYSGLMGQHTGSHHVRLGELDVAEEQTATPHHRSILDFPRGARAGTFFHEVLEHLDFSAARGASLEEQVERRLARHGFETHWTGVVARALEGVLDTPLTAAGDLRLRDIGGAARLNEMAFHFPLAGADTARLGALLTDAPRALEAGPELHGLMKGYVDLVFQHGGRYYVVDYKSNHLGHDPEAYEAGRLQAVMAAHRYDMQYRIYTLALHRYLALRQPDYAYGSHFGGVFYLFLRGMSPATGAARGVWFHRPEEERVEALDRAVAGP